VSFCHTIYFGTVIEIVKLKINKLYE
jgi:hypothetical protein